MLHKTGLIVLINFSLKLKCGHSLKTLSHFNGNSFKFESFYAFLWHDLSIFQLCFETLFIRRQMTVVITCDMTEFLGWCSRSVWWGWSWWGRTGSCWDVRWLHAGKTYVSSCHKCPAHVSVCMCDRGRVVLWYTRVTLSLVNQMTWLSWWLQNIPVPNIA